MSNSEIFNQRGREVPWKGAESVVTSMQHPESMVILKVTDHAKIILWSYVQFFTHFSQTKFSVVFEGYMECLKLVSALTGYFAPSLKQT